MTEALACGRESAVLDRLMDAVEKVDSRLYYSCAKMEEDVSTLARLFGGLPSILDERSFGKELHSRETLVSTILDNGPDHPLMLPTKVVVGRSLLVCRFNFVGFLAKVCAEYPSLSGFRSELQTEWESVLFLLLLEELYHTLLGRKDRYLEALRRQAAIELVHLWEYRSDRVVAEYALTIIDLWTVRRRIVPVFGTMMGTVELLRLSNLLSSRWHEFIAREGGNVEVVQALEEFIFGLTYEDIELARTSMQERKLSVIDRRMLATLLGDGHAVKDPNDPRALYRFFKTRSAAAMRRGLAGIPGPTRTFEEIVLVHFLENTEARV